MTEPFENKVTVNVGTQKILVDQSGHVTVVNAGPVGPRGLNGDGSSSSGPDPIIIKAVGLGVDAEGPSEPTVATHVTLDGMTLYELTTGDVFMAMNMDFSAEGIYVCNAPGVNVQHTALSDMLEVYLSVQSTQTLPGGNLNVAGASFLLVENDGKYFQESFSLYPVLSHMSDPDPHAIQNRINSSLDPIYTTTTDLDSRVGSLESADLRHESDILLINQKHWLYVEAAVAVSAVDGTAETYQILCRADDAPANSDIPEHWRPVGAPTPVPGEEDYYKPLVIVPTVDNPTSETAVKIYQVMPLGTPWVEISLATPKPVFVNQATDQSLPVIGMISGTGTFHWAQISANNIRLSRDPLVNNPASLIGWRDLNEVLTVLSKGIEWNVIQVDTDQTVFQSNDCIVVMGGEDVVITLPEVDHDYWYADGGPFPPPIVPNRPVRVVSDVDYPVNIVDSEGTTVHVLNNGDSAEFVYNLAYGWVMVIGSTNSLGSGSSVPVYVSPNPVGEVYSQPGPYSAFSSYVSSLGDAQFTAVYLPAGTYDQIFINCTVAGNVTLRLCIDSVGPNGLPGELLKDAGTVNTAGSTGFKIASMTWVNEEDRWVWCRVQTEAVVSATTVSVLHSQAGNQWPPWPTFPSSTNASKAVSGIRVINHAIGPNTQPYEGVGVVQMLNSPGSPRVWVRRAA